MDTNFPPKILGREPVETAQADQAVTTSFSAYVDKMQPGSDDYGWQNTTQSQGNTTPNSLPLGARWPHDFGEL